MINFAAELEELNISFVFDPGQGIPLFPPETLKNIIKKSYILICNENEINIIKQKIRYNDKEFFAIVPIIIITKGEKGSILYSKEQNIDCEISSCKAEKYIDPTGAGDIYRSGFLTGLAKGLTLENACKLGSITSSFIIQSKGAQSQNYSLVDIKKKFKETYGYIPKELFITY